MRTKIVPQGRAYFEGALGEDGYKEFVRRSRAERARRQPPDEDARYIEDFAEIFKIPVDKTQVQRFGSRPGVGAFG